MTQSSSSPLLLVNKLAPPLALFAFDAFVMQSPLGFVSIIGALCGLGSVAIQLYQKTLPKNIAAITALVWLLVPVATFGFNAYNNQLAQTRAQQVIAACEDYRAANGRYPRSLSDLVPRYFPEVPRAKIGGMYGNFMYICGDDDASPSVPSGKPSRSSALPSGLPSVATEKATASPSTAASAASGQPLKATDQKLADSTATAHKRSTLLIWTVVPPFYRFVWNFEEKRWGHFD